MTKPAWLKKTYNFDEIREMKQKLRGSKLHTVCEEARCPNISECFSRGTATVMIMGDTCTRSCKFCAVKTGRPLALDPHEPEHVGVWTKNLGLKHIVITSVDRDDLPDQGAHHFAETIHKVREHNPNIIIEILTPDFQGKENLINIVCDSQPKIFNHNLETVERLTPQVRSAAKYKRSLEVLGHVKSTYPKMLTKSGIMLGLGEKEDELFSSMKDLVNHGCDLLTLGQYLQPTKEHLPVTDYIHPDKFAEYKKRGEELGFKAVFSGPFVRSSYMADGFFAEIAL